MAITLVETTVITTPQARFIRPFIVDDATISASSYVTMYPATNLSSKFRTKKWRGTSLTTDYLDCYLGGRKRVNSVALIGHNFEPQTTITITAGYTQGGSEVASGTFQGQRCWWGFGVDGFGEHGFGGYLSSEEELVYRAAGKIRVIYFDTIAPSYLRFALAGASHADGYLEVGRILIDYYQQSTDAASIGGVDFGSRDPSPVSTTIGGQTLKDIQDHVWEETVQFDYVDAEETHKIFYNALTRLGTANPFLVDLLPHMTVAEQRIDNMRYCELTSLNKINLATFDGRGSLSLSLKESL